MTIFKKFNNNNKFIELGTTPDGVVIPSVTWDGVQQKPNTLSGYGITDAATFSQGEKADTSMQPSIYEAKADVIFTVGTSGQFSTINEAIITASKLISRPYTRNGIIVEIKLLSNFIMAEQVIVSGLDLGWIRITSVDPIVTVTRNSINTTIMDNRRPVFVGVKRATLPTIACSFQLSAGTQTNVDAVGVWDSSSVVLDGTKVGFKGFYRALSAYYHSSIICYQPGLVNETATPFRPDFSGGLDHSIYASYGSFVGAPYGKFDSTTGHGVFGIWNAEIDIYRATALSCGMNGVYVRDGARCNAREVDVSNTVGHGFYALHGAFINARCKDAGVGSGGANACGGFGVYAQHAGHIEAEGIVAIGCLTGGIRAEHGSIVNARYADVSNCPIGITASNASTVAALGAKADGCTNNAVFSDGVSTVEFESASALNCGNIAILSRKGSRVNAFQVVATGATSRGANATQGGFINADGANFRKNTSADTTGTNGDMVVFDGGQIMATRATGGKNVTVNTISNNGIIWQ